MDKIIDFIVTSSADPQRTSLTVRSILVGFIPAVLWATGALDAIGYDVTLVNANFLDMLANQISEIVRQAFIAINAIIIIGSILGSIYGALRKVAKTALGTNAALNK